MLQKKRGFKQNYLKLTEGHFISNKWTLKQYVI